MNGSMRQRGQSDTWELTVDLGRDPATGKKRRIYETVKGKRKAQTRLHELIASAEAGYTLNPERIPVAEHLESWLSSYAANNTRPRTAAGYANKLRLYIIPKLGRVSLRSLEPSAIQATYIELLDSGLSAMSVKHTHRILREALEHAVTQGLIARNPCQAVTPPRPERKTMRWLNASELQRVLDGAKETPYYAVFHTLLFTGLRRGEALGLRVRDVDLTLGTIHVSQSLNSLPGGRVALSEPKSAKGRRTIALTPSNSVVLRDHLDKLSGDMAMLDVPMTDDTLVFSWPDGRPMLPSALTHAWIRIVRSVGLSGVRLHDARHTHASLMLAQNVHPKIVQERLGHSSIAITLDTYSHAMPGLQAAAALGFDQAVGKSSESVPIPTRQTFGRQMDGKQEN